MKPLININWKQKSTRLVKKLGSIQEAAYQCGIPDHTYRRIMKGTKTSVDYDCGVLLLWQLENHNG
ncbi:MAG: hypothetical protein V3R25_10060 [Nitrosomonadaceae bacterium]